jgi:RNA polymerase sigma factor (sigma-70 family)
MQKDNLMDPYQTFNALAETTKSYEALHQVDLEKIFLQIEKRILYGIDFILLGTTFVEDNLCYLLSEIAIGSIKSRKVYRGKKNKSRIAIGEELDVGAENLRIYSTGFDLFKLSKADRQVAAPLVRKTIRNMRLLTHCYENILLAFVSETEKYTDLAEELAQLTAARRNLSKKEQGPLPARFGQLVEEMRHIELSVGCVAKNLLYGTVKTAQHVLEEVQALQERILRAYLRLVLSPARRESNTQMDAFDLFQSGSLGLKRAVSLYNFRSGSSFSQFAKWWIKQRILGHVKNSGALIRLSSSVWEKYQEYRRAERRLDAKGEPYTSKDIAEELGVTEQSLRRLLQKVAVGKVVSFSSFDSENERETAEQMIPDSSIDEQQEEEEMRTFVADILEHLDVEDRRLVCLKYGLIESIPNDNLNPDEVLLEMFRQLSCKAKRHKTIAAQAYGARSSSEEAVL